MTFLDENHIVYVLEIKIAIDALVVQRENDKRQRLSVLLHQLLDSTAIYASQGKRIFSIFTKSFSQYFNWLLIVLRNTCVVKSAELVKR